MLRWIYNFFNRQFRLKSGGEEDYSNSTSILYIIKQHTDTSFELVIATTGYDLFCYHAKSKNEKIYLTRNEGKSILKTYLNQKDYYLFYENVKFS